MKNIFKSLPSSIQASVVAILAFASVVLMVSIPGFTSAQSNDQGSFSPFQLFTTGGSTYMRDKTATWKLQVRSLGSTGSPCLNVGTTGIFGTTTCGTGGGGSSTPSVGSAGWVQFASTTLGAFDGTSTLFWNNSTGKLGIGTGTPPMKLSVISLANDDGIALYNSTTGGTVARISQENTDDGRIILYNGNTVNVDIQGGGTSYFRGGNTVFGANGPINSTVGVRSNLAIGTNFYDDTAPVNGLLLEGGFGDGSSATGTFGNILTSTGTSTKWMATSSFGFATGTNFWSPNGTSIYSNNGGGTGFVGIGETVPQTELHLRGSSNPGLTIASGPYSSGRDAFFFGVVTSPNGFVQGSQAGDTGIVAKAGGTMLFGVSPNTGTPQGAAMAIGSGGNLGLYMSSSTGVHNILGTLYSNFYEGSANPSVNNIVFNANSSSNYMGIRSGGNGTNGTLNFGRTLLPTSAITPILTVRDNDTVGIGTTTATAALTVIGSSSISSLSAANCDVMANTFGALYCGTNGAGGSGNSAWTIGSGLIFNATSTDFVGIGTSTPTSTLDIQGKAGNFMPLRVSSSSGASMFEIEPNAFIGFSTSTPGSPFVVASSTGNRDRLFSVNSDGTTNTTGISTASGFTGSTLAITNNLTTVTPNSISRSYTSGSDASALSISQTNTGGNGGIVGALRVAAAKGGATDPGAKQFRSISGATAYTGTGNYTDAIGVYGDVTKTGASGSIADAYSIFGNSPLASGGGSITRAWSGGFNGNIWVATSTAIGTTSTAQALNVQGNQRLTGAFFDGSNASGTSGMVLSSTGTSTQWMASAGGGGNSAWTIGSGLIYNATSTDKVGVGTSTPQSALSIVANALGGLFIRTVTNIVNAFTIHNASGTPVFNVDTTATEAAFSIGTTTASSTLTVQSGTNNNPFSIFKAISAVVYNVFKVDSSGHQITGGPAPVISTCGTTPTVVGDDTNGAITTSGTVNACTVTFANSFPVTPVCTFNINKTGIASMGVTALSASSFTVGFSGSIGTAVIYYHCEAHQ